MTELLSFCCSKPYLASKQEEAMKTTLTSAPMTPKEVSLRYSNGRVLEVVLRNGYKNKGIWAIKKTD